MYGWFDHAARVPDLLKVFLGREVSAQPGTGGRSFLILPAQDP